MPGAGAARRGAALRRAAGLGGPASPGPTPHGPFWLILDSLGGSALGAALGMLQPGGTCVTFGVSEAPHTTLASRDFFATGGGGLYALTPLHERLSVGGAGVALARRA